LLGCEKVLGSRHPDFLDLQLLPSQPSLLPHGLEEEIETILECDPSISRQRTCPAPLYCVVVMAGLFILRINWGYIKGASLRGSSALALV